MSKPVILFIDDEANILRGLQRLLRSQRDQWEMVFLGGGDEAVKWLVENSPDAIVTDMRMPVVDGADVLQAASDLSRGRARFVLSGEADRVLTYRTVGTSHQFFSKPCNDKQLVRAINSAFSLGDELLTREQQIQISNLRAPPCMSLTWDSLNEVFTSDGSVDDLTRIAAQDPGLALRLLQLANSSYFGRPADTLSIASAVSRLGMETMQQLWNQKRLVAMSDSSEIDAELISISQAGVECAREVFDISTHNGASDKDCEDSYTLGLLAWAGDALCAANDISDDWRVRLNTSAYAATLYGLPARMAYTLEILVKGAFKQTNSHERSRELGEIMYDNMRAA